MKSVMLHQFSQVPTVDCPRSRFDRSCGYKTTADSGYLVPFFFDEVLPGDTFDVNATIFGRLATPFVPIMDNIFIDTFFFYVPLRLLWSNFEKFMGAQDDPGDSTEYLVPQVTAPSGGFTNGSLYDYFGIPTAVSGLKIDSLFLRAYNKIWNTWFRDENLQQSVVDNMGDGPDTYTDYTLLRRGKRHDYFTSCLPWPMKPVGGTGNVGVSLPLGTTAPVVTGQLKDGFYLPLHNTNNNTNLFGRYLVNSTNNISLDTGTTSTDSGKYTCLVTDLSNATAATVNQLRQAFQLQKYYERTARCGSRYIEILLGHFGVKSPDARLQRPEYLGGSSNRININQVEQNAGTSAGTSSSPLGTLGAYGIFASNKNGFSKSFVEHGVIIGMFSVRADLTYQQGLDRMWSRQTLVDFYWPSFAHLGEQAVLNKEIYAQGPSVVDSDGNKIDDKVFGYQERYAEYRYKPSLITGEFRSNYAQTLDVWHLSQNFVSLPTLSSQFIEDNPPIARVQAVQNEPQILFDSYIQNICIRPMPVYSVPGLVDHF